MSSHCTPNHESSDVEVDYNWVMSLMNRPYNDSHLELMLNMSLLLGSFAFSDMVLQALITIDPIVVLGPTKLGLMQDVLIHTPNQKYGSEVTAPDHNLLIEFHVYEAEMTVEEHHQHTGKRALTYKVISRLIGIMLNAVYTSLIITGV